MDISTQNISPYIANIRDWKIREIIGNYLEALITFKSCNRPLRKGTIMTFSNLRKICDILWDAKENFHLIFKRVLNPKKQIFEQAEKLTPTEREIKFMNNIGLLFHRVMGARELKYVLDYYEVDSAVYKETREALIANIKKIDQLFDEGADLLVHIFEDYLDNIKLIAYLFDNRRNLEPIFKKEFNELIETIFADRHPDEVYMETARYYRDSGWSDKARDVIREVLTKNPENKEALQLLDELKQDL